MTHYTLILYRPNDSDYYRGHCNGSSDSELEIVSCDTQDEVAQEIFIKWKWYDDLDQNDKNRYAEYEFTILIDGRNPDSYFTIDEWDIEEEINKEISSIKSKANEAWETYKSDKFKIELDKAKKLELARQEAFRQAEREKEIADRKLYEEFKKRFEEDI